MPPFSRLRNFSLEVNLLVARIKDLKERTDVLRGYL